jgi:drug/metabolite transporter (DMT)-like permease
MNTQVFPNNYKKIGLLLFFIGIFVAGYPGFIEGWSSGLSEISKEPVEVVKRTSHILFHLFDIVAIIGMMIYMFSKEKIEDDFINKLRLESFQTTSIVGLIITIIFFAFSKDIKYSLDDFLISFLISYLLIFWYKKRQY